MQNSRQTPKNGVCRELLFYGVRFNSYYINNSFSISYHIQGVRRCYL